MDNELVRIMDYQHIKQGRGSAFVRVTMRNLRTGSTTERTFQAGSKFTVARLERRSVQFLYEEAGAHYFMDTETYEQFPLPRDILGNAVNYLKESDVIDLLTYQDKPIDIEIPVTATLETGLVVNVPLFLNEGDLVKVDTRTGAYLERVSG